MKIAIIGYGKMGRTIEKIAKKENIEVVCIVDKNIQEGDLSKADVSINFSVPSAAVENILKSFGKIYGISNIIKSLPDCFLACNVYLPSTKR